MGVASFVVAVASYPAAVLSGYIVSTSIRKGGRNAVTGAFWPNLLPAVTAPLAVGGLAGILWVLPQTPDGRFVVAFIGAVGAAILAWSLVYRMAYRVPGRSVLLGAVCVPLLAVPVTAFTALMLGAVVGLLWAAFVI